MNNAFETSTYGFSDAVRTPIPSNSTAARPNFGKRCADARKPWWRRLWMDEYTAYLSRATDCADLERRIRTWDETERRDHMPLV